MNQSILTHQKEPRLAVGPIITFALAQLNASVRSRRLLATALTPLFILLLFWFTARGSGDAELVSQLMFPAIVGLSVMFGGGMQAMRLINWREQKIFQRLAVTPVPLGQLVVGDVLAQAVVALVQGVITILFGVLLLGLPVDGWGTAVSLIVLFVGAACFLAYGSLIAAFVTKAEPANSLFIFTLLPMFFIGGGFPPGLLPELVHQIGQWLPVGLVNRLLVPLLIEGRFPEQTAVSLLALLAYTAVFSLIAMRFFRTE